MEGCGRFHGQLGHFERTTAKKLQRLQQRDPLPPPQQRKKDYVFEWRLAVATAYPSPAAASGELRRDKVGLKSLTPQNSLGHSHSRRHSHNASTMFPEGAV